MQAEIFKKDETTMRTPYERGEKDTLSARRKSAFKQ